MLFYIFVFFIKRPLLDPSELSLVASVCPSACLVILLGKGAKVTLQAIMGRVWKKYLRVAFFGICVVDCDLWVI